MDNNGAGDSLAGGFLAGMVRGLPIVSAIKEGIEMAALSIRQEGCTFKKIDQNAPQTISKQKNTITYTKDEQILNDFYENSLKNAISKEKSRV